MKRSTPLGLGIFLFLGPALVPVFPAGAEPGIRPRAAAARPGAVQANGPLESRVEMPRQDVEKILKQIPGKELHRLWVNQLLRNQEGLAVRLWNLKIDLARVLALLAATALLAAGALWQGQRKNRALRVLQEQVQELTRLLETWEPGTHHPAASAVDAESSPPFSRLTPQEDSSTREAPGPRPPHQDLTHPASAGDEETVPLLPAELRHRGIALLLARLRREAPRLAAGFADPALRERFRGEFEAPLGARLDRLQVASQQRDEELVGRWLGTDLVSTLDSLACFYSEAIDEQRRVRASVIASELREWLYDSFDRVCREEGWFAIDPVDPYVTRFDHKVHRAVAGRDVDGAEGLIIAVRAIGQRDPRNGAVFRKAEVIVGR